MWTKKKKQDYFKYYSFINKEKILLYQKNYRTLHKKKILNQQKEWRKQNKYQIKKIQTKWNIDNKNHLKEYKHQYYLKNKKKLRKQNKKWRNNNRQKINFLSKKYQLKRRHNDINYKILGDLRTRLYLALKNNSKFGHTLELLGCSIEFLKKHLEAKFQEGMNWSNYGINGWEIDHIKPLSKFDLTKTLEQKKACYYKNLQPLWASENRKKKDKYEQEK